MRKTGMNGWDVLNASGMLVRSIHLAAIAAGVAIVMSSGVARAQDADADDGESFEQKIIKNIMTGIGGTSMESDKGIDYRERSPLVIPPKIDLPPPGSVASEINAPNWPKDPDVQRRKAAVAANKQSKPTPMEGGRSILPSKLATGGSGIVHSADADQPGKPTTSNGPMLSPSQLGFTGKLGDLLGGNAPQIAPFKGEPDREALTQPPPGYQTPSPNFAYGTGPKEALGAKHIDIMSGKEVSNQ